MDGRGEKWSCRGSRARHPLRSRSGAERCADGDASGMARCDGTWFRGGTDNRISSGVRAGMMTPVSSCGSVSRRLMVSRVRGMNSAWRFGAPENFSTRGLTPPGPPQVTRIQRPKIQSSVLATRKPTIAAPVTGGVPLTRYAERTNLGKLVPRAATQHPTTAIPFTRPRSSVLTVPSSIAHRASSPLPTPLRSRAHCATQTHSPKTNPPATSALLSQRLPQPVDSSPGCDLSASPHQ